MQNHRCVKWARWALALVLSLSLHPAARAQGQGEREQSDPYMQLVGDALGYVQFNDWQEMLDACEQAIAMAPDRTHAWELRAKALLELGRYDEARSSYEKLVGIMPDKATTIIYNTGEVYFREGKFDQALDYFQRYVKKEKNDRRRYFGDWKILLCHLKLGNDSAADQIIDSIQPGPFEPLYYYAHAARDFALGSKKEAHKDLIKANRIYPQARNNEYGEALIHLGWLDMDDLNSEFLSGSQQQYQIEDLTARAIQGGVYYSDPTQQAESPIEKEKPKTPELPSLE